MPSVNFYFQVHQPYRLAYCSPRATQKPSNYFDEEKNREIFRKVAHKCYLPANELMLKLIARYKGAFRIAYSLTGMVIDQMKSYAPEVLDSFKHLRDTDCVEFIGETYYHSLSALYDLSEFKDQVEMHRDLMRREFGFEPTVFRNTELIYNDDIGQLVGDLGYHAVIAEGCDDVLDGRSPNYVYGVPSSDTKLLLKNYRLSDDIAFRFSNRAWKEFPLHADKYADWLHEVSDCGDVVNLFMDYETFGEHQWAESGIFDFMEHLPAHVLTHPDWNFMTPSEVIDCYDVREDVHFHRLTSWADEERDTTAWVGNSIQQRALDLIYEVGDAVLALDDQELIDTWRKMQASDHFYYMCTKWFADGDVHAYFSPYESPYVAFINFMSSVENFANHLPAPKVETIIDIDIESLSEAMNVVDTIRDTYREDRSAPQGTRRTTRQGSTV